MSKRDFLAYDGPSIIDYNYRIYHISLWEGYKRLAQPWKYHLHHTMGRPMIVINKVWRNR